MRLYSFQIKNFKSIIDSKECFVDEKTTILAGQNGSGKSNILLALTKINYEHPNIQDEDNLDAGEDLETAIIYKFLLNEDEKKQIAEIKGFDNFIQTDEKNRTLVLVKVAAWTRNIEFLPNYEAIKDKCINVLRNFVNEHGLEIKVTEYNEEVLEQVISEYEAKEDFVEEVISELKESCLKIKSIEPIQRYIEENLPKFILQTTKDMLPDSFEKNTSLKCLERLENCLNKSFKEVFDLAGNPQKQKNLLKEYSDSFNIDFETKYTQKKVSIDFDINGDSIGIYIHDQDSKDGAKIGKGYKLSQRSLGLLWYLNFYITLKGENIKDDDVILIDEPGMHLHARAQEELRDQVLFKFPKQNQIIYTTHSPYLINSNELKSIRLVEKNSQEGQRSYYEQTVISEKLHKYNNIDSIKPIADAIGYAMGAEFNLNTSCMLICEGVSDCLYLREILKQNGKFGITHANGVQKIPNLVLLYQGLGVKNIFVLVDSDRDGIRIRNQLIESKILEESEIFETHGSKNIGKSIEDLFNKEFFLKQILCYSTEQIKNSKDLISQELKEKHQKEGKYLLAKHFCNIYKNYRNEEVLNEDGLQLINKITERIQQDIN